MPEELERKLKSKAKKKFGSIISKRARKHVYGTMRKTGWIPSTQKKKHKSHKPIEKYHDGKIEVR